MENSNFNQEDDTKLNEDNKSSQRSLSVAGTESSSSVTGSPSTRSSMDLHVDDDLNCNNRKLRLNLLEGLTIAEGDIEENVGSRLYASKSINENKIRHSRRALKVVVNIAIALIQAWDDNRIVSN